MADYEGKIQLSVQGLKQISDLDEKLVRAASNADSLSDKKIQLRVTGADALSKIAAQMSAIETRAVDLASAVSRIGASATVVQFDAKINRASLNKELDLVSRQFQRRNWRLNVNDTSVKAANAQVDKLRKNLENLISKEYVISVKYRYTDPPGPGRAGGRPPTPGAPRGGASPEDIAKRAGEAMANGLSSRLYSDAVAGARSGATREALIKRFQERVQRPQSPGGINQALAKRYIEALGGKVEKGTSPQGLAIEAERLLREVDQSIIDNITKRVDELKLALQMPRNMRPKVRPLPIFNELLERMSEQTTRPAEAARMLKMLPSRLITTDLAGLASDQAARYVGPDVIPAGADRLFAEITRLFRDYFKQVNPAKRIIPPDPWLGPTSKAYALEEIMTWQPWMAEPRWRRGSGKLLPSAGETARAVPLLDFSSIQTSYDEEVAKRNISRFAREVFNTQRRPRLPSAGETARAVPLLDFSSIQTSYDEEVAKRNISRFAREVFNTQRRPRLPSAGGNRSLVPTGIYDQIIPVNVRDVSPPPVNGIFNVGQTSFTPRSTGVYSMARQYAGLLPAAQAPGSRPYMEPNWNELIDRMAAVTRRPAAASRTLRALPRQMITTDLAGLASDQAAGMFAGEDRLGKKIRSLGREAGLALSPLDRISDAFKDIGLFASKAVGSTKRAINLAQQVLAGAGPGGGAPGGGGPGGGGPGGGGPGGGGPGGGNPPGGAGPGGAGQRFIPGGFPDVFLRENIAETSRLSKLRNKTIEGELRRQLAAGQQQIRNQYSSRIGYASQEQAFTKQQVYDMKLQVQDLKDAGIKGRDLVDAQEILSAAMKADAEASKKLAEVKNKMAEEIKEFSSNLRGNLLRQIPSVSNYQGARNRAEQNLAEVQIGTADERIAIENYVQTLQRTEALEIQRQKEIKSQIAAENRRRSGMMRRGEILEPEDRILFDERRARAKQRLAAIRGQRKEKFNSAIYRGATESLIGGAFPLLFGQGPATSIGGAIGGAAGFFGPGAGFAGGLLGSAIGMQVDTLAQNLSSLATSLKSPNDAIKALETNGYRVSDSLKFQVEQLQAVGRGYDAQALVLKEVERRLGAGSVKELSALNAEQKKLDESFALLTGRLQSGLIPALITVTNTINGIVDLANQAGQIKANPALDSLLNALIPSKKPVELIIGGLQGRGRQIARASQVPPLSPQERFANETTRIQESRKIADQIQSAYREAFNLQRQAHDLQRDGATLNKEIADYTYRKEREIFDFKQQAAEKQIENTRAAAQNRIEGGDLSARQTFAAAVGFEQQLLSNVREVVRARKEGEADIEQSRNRLELAMARLNRDVEDYKRTNAREIEDIERRKLAYVRSVEDYKMRVADYILDRSRKSADLIKQAMVLPETGPSPAGATLTPKTALPTTGKVPNTLMGVRGIIEYLTGDTRSPGYRADHGGSNYHDHIAFASRQIRDNVIAMLRANGVQIGSIEGGRHAPNSYHYSGQAIDIPAAQVSVGKEKDLSARVRQLITSFLGGTPQAKAATTIEDIPKPVFKNVPVGPTPSAAPANAARIAAAAAMGGNEKEAQRILEEGIKLKQKGIELGQIEAILQANQLPQLQQQGDALKQQIEARQKIVNLSDNAASIADIEAESRSRLKQIEANRISALAQVQKRYKGDVALTEQVNQQAELAVEIAKGEEKQRRINLELSNKLQNSEQARLQILQLQEGVAISKVELAALERGELQAGAVELLKASTLYQRSDEAQKSTLVTLTAQTEELQKQKQFMEKLVSLQLDATYAGAGLRSGRIGAEARAYEQALKENKGDIGKATALANATRAAEDRQMVWGNLEKDIVNASNAISGSLTNGLLDIVSGAKQIEDVGRDMLDTIARSFADSAQQQLATLLQRQFAGMISGSIGTGTAAAGPQALNGASLTAAGSLGFLNNAALALGATLQTIAGQSAFSGQIGGSGFAGLFGGATNAAAGGISAVASGASGLLGFSSAIPQLAPTLESIPNFAGFFANGGRMFAGEFGVVGEEEPEFFFPGVSGTVVPRSKIEKAAELRQLNQQPQEIDVRYTVTEQHGERYVTEQQFRQGMAQTRQTAQAMFISSVRQNKDVRDSMRI